MVETIELEQFEDIQILSQTATMPRVNRGQRNGVNGDDGDDDRQDEKESLLVT